MRKKIYIILPILCFLLIIAFILYHNIGWFQGDILEYIEHHYAPDGKSVISGEYLAAGEDNQGGFIIYNVTTQDGTSHFIRVNVVFHRYLTKVGSGFKIKGISEISDYEVETMNP